MSKTQWFVELFILLLGFILGGWGVGTAHADFTADMFTGTWNMQCLDIGSLLSKLAFEQRR